MFSLRAPIFWGAVLIALLLPNEVLATGETNEVRVASYNVENYLSMTRRINGRLRANAGQTREGKGGRNQDDRDDPS